jgi:hypothetical protein
MSKPKLVEYQQFTHLYFCYEYANYWPKINGTTLKTKTISTLMWFIKALTATDSTHVFVYLLRLTYFCKGKPVKQGCFIPTISIFRFADT